MIQRAAVLLLLAACLLASANASNAAEPRPTNRCGNTSSPQAFFESNAGMLPAAVARSGGAIAKHFTGTYHLALGPDATHPGRVFVDQITPQRSVPHAGESFTFNSATDSYVVDPREVSIGLEAHPTLRGAIHCDQATGAITFIATSRHDAASFVHLETKLD